MKTLSQAGRLVLIQSVASTLPAYSMSQFLLPKVICSRLDSMMLRFWWGHPDDGARHLLLKAWASICHPKSLGGLGSKLMWDTSRAHITKLA